MNESSGNATPPVWKTLARRAVADYTPWLRLWEEDVELPNGEMIEHFTQVELPSFVVIAAVTEDGRMVVERSYKHAARRVSISLPAGFIEAEEDPLLGAQRELLEETGYAAPHWESLGAFIVDGNRHCGSGHLFLARQAYRSAEPNPGDLEEILIELMGLEQVLEATRTGGVLLLPAATAIGLALAALR